MKTRVTILGSTGSVGLSALEVIRAHPDRFEVIGLAAGRSVDAMLEQVHEFAPAFVAMADEAAATKLSDSGTAAQVLSGPEGVSELAAADVDVVLCAIVGAAGLGPVISAIDAGNRIALANKEPMVMAGRLITERARKCGVEILPVDSEHNAIFQCLHGNRMEEVHKVHLTASGGPFYKRRPEELDHVTPAEATSHPTWNMGAKISVDSATLMNKGLEIIEARWLFDLPLDKINVLIHPRSIVHSLVEFVDGSILAHLGVTDMKLPIQFALTWPERVESPIARLDLTAMGALTFAPPDFNQFPCLALARSAAQRGGTAPAVLNAANEEAVAAFRREELGFTGIARVVEEVLSNMVINNDTDLPTVLVADAEARRRARAAVGTKLAART